MLDLGMMGCSSKSNKPLIVVLKNHLYKLSEEELAANIYIIQETNEVVINGKIQAIWNEERNSFDVNKYEGEVVSALAKYPRITYINHKQPRPRKKAVIKAEAETEAEE